MKIRDEKIAIKELEKKSEEAKELLQDEDKIEKVLERLEQKLDKIPLIGQTLGMVPMLISLIRAYIKKEYTDIPLGSIIAIISSLLYFLSPVDLMPDTIPGVGYIDDAWIIAVTLKLVRDDIAEYEEWQSKNGKRIIVKKEKK